MRTNKNQQYSNTIHMIYKSFLMFISAWFIKPHSKMCEHLDRADLELQGNQYNFVRFN